MGLLNVFKKNSVPDELPKLVSDEIEEKDKIFVQAQNIEKQDNIEEKNNQIESIKKEKIFEPNQESTEQKTNFRTEEESEIDKIKKEIEKEKEKIIEKKEPENNYQIGSVYIPRKNKSLLKNNIDDDKSFFKELEDDLNLEIEDLDKLEDWYKNKFLPRDVVYDMKKHWENKKNNAIIKVLGRNFQARINEKTEKLQKLERDWQNAYFDLIEKEEEIREEEQELKKMLEEFVELCKRKTIEDEKEEEF